MRFSKYHRRKHCIAQMRKRLKYLAGIKVDLTSSRQLGKATMHKWALHRFNLDAAKIVRECGGKEILLALYGTDNVHHIFDKSFTAITPHTVFKTPTQSGEI